MSSSVPLQNVYYERKVATAKPCYICRRPTRTVLATLKTDDFVYTCDAHLTDTGFASPITAPPLTPTPEDIRRVIAEHQARESKKSKSTSDPKSTSGTDKDKPTDPPLLKPSTPPVPAPIPVPTASPPASHRKFALHRSIFDMRRNELRRKEQVGKAKEVSKGAEIAFLMGPSRGVGRLIVEAEPLQKMTNAPVFPVFIYGRSVGDANPY